MLNGKHYRMIARCIKDNTNSGRVNGKPTMINRDMLIDDLCVEFNLDNYLFSRSKFRDACND